MSGESFPIRTAEELVRYLLGKDYSAEHIERELSHNPLGQHASREEWSRCKRMLTNRRRYEAAVARLIEESEYPSAEAIARLLSTDTRSVDERTVRRWRDGDLG